MLNPFAILGGLLSVAVLALHGAGWIALKTDGELQRRARRWAGGVWWLAAVLLVAMVAASFVVRPDVTRNFVEHPWLVIVPLVAIVATGVLRIALGIYLFGMALVGLYLVNVYRVWRGKVSEVYH